MIFLMNFLRLVWERNHTQTPIESINQKKHQAEFQKVTIFIFIFWPTDWTMLNKKNKKR